MADFRQQFVPLFRHRFVPLAWPYNERCKICSARNEGAYSRRWHIPWWKFWERG